MFLMNKKEFKSSLYNQYNFYNGFIHDLKNCKNEVIIESPYMTSSRMEILYPVFKKLLLNRVKILIITRDPVDHEDEYMRNQATNEILYSNEIGIKMILLKGYHHRKLAILDRNILWEGSLNILSYRASQEIMRRIESNEVVNQIVEFLQLDNLS